MSPLQARSLVVIVSVLIAGGCSSDQRGSASTTAPVGIVSIGPTADSIVESPVCRTAVDIAAVLASVDVTDRSGISELPAAISRLAAIVPVDLAADVSTLSTAIASFVAVLKRFDFDIAAIEADPAAKAELATLDDPAARAASERIQAWLGDQCG